MLTPIVDDVFVMTDAHINAARRLSFYIRDGVCVCSSEYRPYGNSDMIGDLAEFFCVPTRDEKVEEFLMYRHLEMVQVISLMVNHGIQEPGVYARNPEFSGYQKLCDVEEFKKIRVRRVDDRRLAVSGFVGALIQLTARTDTVKIGSYYDMTFTKGDERYVVSDHSPSYLLIIAAVREFLIMEATDVVVI